MDFLTTPRTNKEELYAYFVLKKHLFENKYTYVGESGVDLGEPDIMTADHKIGCEVTMCETQSGFALAQKLFGVLREENFDLANLKFINKPVYYKRGKVDHKVTFTVQSKAAEFNQTSEEILEALEYVLTKKLLKLNHGNYSTPQKIYLMVLSDFVSKQSVSISDYKNMFDKVSASFEKQYDGVFVTLNNQLYLFDKDGAIRVMTDQKTLTAQKNDLNYHLGGGME